MNIITSTFSKQKFRILLTFGLDILFLLIVFAWNKYLSKLIDFVTAGNPLTSRMIIQFIAILMIYVLVNGFTSFYSNFTCEQINFTLRNNYVKMISNQPPEFFEKFSGGQGASVFLNELSAVSGFISGNLFFIFDSLIKFIGTFSWFIVLNPFLALSSNLPVFLIIIYVSFSSKVLQKYTEKTNEENTNLNFVTESLMNLFPVIRLYSADKLILSKFSDSLLHWEKLNISMEKKKALLMSISAVMTSIPLALVILIGGNQIIKGKLTIGQLYIFINLSGNVSGILMNMPSFLMQLRIFCANLNRLSKN